MACLPSCPKIIRAKAAHCPACHETFSSTRLFDRHQDVDYDRRPVVICKEPESVGLVLDTWGTWRTPENLMVTTARISAMNTARHASKGEK